MDGERKVSIGLELSREVPECDQLRDLSHSTKVPLWFKTGTFVRYS